MKKGISFRIQLFLACLLLISVPMVSLGIFTANRTASQVAKEHEQTFHMMTRQLNLNLNSLLSDVEKIGNLHLLNDDIRRALVTDYSADTLALIKDSTMMQTQISQANRLNTNVLFSLFKNKYDYYYDYNILGQRNLQQSKEQMEALADKARNSDRNTYFGNIMQPNFTGAVYRNLLPMVRILYDANTTNEIGLFYVGINFDAIVDVVNPAALPNSNLFFINQDGSLLFPSASRQKEVPMVLLAELQQISAGVEKESPEKIESIQLDGVEYSAHILYNRTTGWKIVHYMDNSIIKKAQYQNLQSYGIIFLVSMVLSLLLAMGVSYGLTKSLVTLSHTINEQDVENLTPITIEGGMQSRELKGVVESYNALTNRLEQSMNQNFQNQINENRLKLQMLQMQINPHFLYNTLNLISSLANIHEVPEIKTISDSISDILRYNLRSGPIVQLREEIQQVYQYIEIQKIRFPNKFEFDCYIPTSLLEVSVPAFILQPLVENAIQHGLHDKETNACIGIQAYGDGSLLHVFLIDNGTGLSPTHLIELQKALSQAATLPRQQQNIGLLNVQQRLVAYYGAEYGLYLESEEGHGTVVEIRIPLSGKG